jgi:hypothetical protein
MVASLTPHDAAKLRELEALLAGPIVDTWRLRELALLPGGLVNGTRPSVRPCCGVPKERF